MVVVCKVHGDIPLIALLIKHLLFEAQTAVFQRSVLIIEELINRTGIDYLLRYAVIRLPLSVVVDTQSDLDAIKQFLDDPVIAANGYALITVIKIIIIIAIADREAFDDKRRQVFAIPSPLFLRISFDQFLIDLTPYQ